MLQKNIKVKEGSVGRVLPAFAVGSLAVLAIATLCPIQTQGVSATDNAGAATFSGWLSSSVTLTMADSVSQTIEPTVNGSFKNLSTNARVQVSNSDYYSMMLKGTPAMTNNLNADAKIDAINAEKTGNDFSANTWGYNVRAGASQATDATAAYKPVNTVGDTVVDKKTLGDVMSADDTYTLNFGAKVDTSIPAGTYTSQVMLSVVASPKLVTGFDRTDTMQGMTADICKEIGTSADTTHITDSVVTDALGNKVYTKRLKDKRDQKYYWVAKLADGNCWMTQNLDLDIPAAGFNNVETALASGKTSWKPEQATYTTSDPNRFTLPDNGDWAKMSSQADHSWDEGQYVLIYPGEGNAGLYIGMKAKEAGVDRDNNGTPQDGLKSFGDKSEVLGQTGVEQAGNLTSLQGSKVLTDYGVVMDVSSGWTATTDPKFTAGSTYIAENGATVNKTAGWAIDPVNKVYDAHYLIGNYYQWYAATAQTREEGNAVETAGKSVEGSICAKNWQLPTSGSYGEGAGTLNNPTYNSANGSFFNLINKTSSSALITTGTSGGSNAQVNNGYSTLSQIISGSGDTAIKTENILTGSPMHFLRAGYVNPWSTNQQVRDVGGDGYYWSSVADSATSARNLGFSAANVYPSGSNYRAYGFSVRCLVLSSQN